MAHGGNRTASGRKPMHPQIRDWAVRAVKTAISKDAISRAKRAALQPGVQKLYASEYHLGETEQEERATENVMDVIENWKDVKKNPEVPSVFDDGKVNAIIIDAKSVPNPSSKEMNGIFRGVAASSASAIKRIFLTDTVQYLCPQSLTPVQVKRLWNLNNQRARKHNEEWLNDPNNEYK